MEKQIQSINFDKPVLDRLKEKSIRENIKISKLVNHIVRGAVMEDADFYGQMAKYHAQKCQEYITIKERLEIMKEVKK